MKLKNGQFSIIILFLSYEKAFQFNPHNEDLWQYQANFCKELNKSDEAAEQLLFIIILYLSSNKALQSVYKKYIISKFKHKFY